MSDLKWLDYFTDNIADVMIIVGERPHTARTNPDFVMSGPVVSFSDSLEAVIFEPASDEQVTKGEFFQEMSKILETESQWESLFTHHGVNLSLSQGNKRYRLHSYIKDTGSGRKTHSTTIRQLPPQN